MATNKFSKAFGKAKNDNHTNNATTNVGKKITIGGELLNAASQTIKQKEMEVIYVLPKDIYPSPENTISMNESEIEDLAQSFTEVGMLNPLIVREMENKKYRIVCGERRYRATNLNIEKGLRSAEQPIKCHLFNPELVDLPLNEDEKEDYVRDVENAQQRNKTDGDKLMLMRKFKARYELLRERDPERFKGIKTRELLSEDLDISKSTVAQFQKVENQGSNALKQALIDEQVTITTAVDIASMPEKKQEDLINKVLGNNSVVTKKDVNQYQYEEKNQNKNTFTEEKEDEVLEDGKSLITEKSLKKEMKDIFKHLKEKNGVKVDSDELLSILNKIREIEKILKKN
ncbi:Nucleoid occlusion protein [Tyzzerella nexilis]|uniref:Nucleoid occlusion protein n=1 Tax=[Clostridium] nexile TaxID=29361 RepID=A0A6N2VRY2_9FIRM